MSQLRKHAALVLLWGFLLGVHQGKLALWQEGQAQPVQIYDIRAASLPPADRLALGRGIRVEDRRELWAVLENYLE